VRPTFLFGSVHHIITNYILTKGEEILQGFDQAGVFIPLPA